MEYYNLFKNLADFNVRYLICGGLAVNIYGIPRMTADIDIMLDFTEENIHAFERAIDKLSYTSTILQIKLQELIDKSKRSNIIKEKNMIAYSYHNTKHSFMSIDVLIDTPFQFDEIWDRREVRSYNEIEINIIHIKDLIKMKEYSNRIQDQQDIHFLSKMI